MQRFESGDPKRAAMLQFVQDMVGSRGNPSDKTFEGARSAGYTDEQIIEIISNVALTTFSNYLNDSIETDVDVPQVEPVQSR